MKWVLFAMFFVDGGRYVGDPSIFGREGRVGGVLIQRDMSQEQCLYIARIEESRLKSIPNYALMMCLPQRGQ